MGVTRSSGPELRRVVPVQRSLAPAWAPALAPALALALALALVLALATAALPRSAAEGSSAAGQGWRSGGDPYFPLDGNRGYDVQHYTIRDTYHPATDRLRGRTRLRLRATEELARFHLDLALAADWVRVDGKPASFGKPHRHELRVVPHHPIAAGSTAQVVVGYHGRPGSTRAAGVSPFRHAPGEGVAMGEPQIGAWWFAANETPADTATYDIVLRVPRGVEALSNGQLVQRTRAGRWTTWHWAMDQPMTTYLAFFAVGQFQIERERAGAVAYLHGVSTKLSARERTRSLRLLRRTPGIVAWLSEEYGDYPFDQAGGVVSGLRLSYALETQTRPVYPYLGGPSRWSISLLVHEQAHQWFGNHVALTRWRDLWLNEGFATYVEWRYAEDRHAEPVARRLQEEYDAYPASSWFWDVQVSDPGPRQMWSEPIYVRGAMMLAALRNRVGDARFDAVLAAWLARHGGGHGTGTGFRALAEEVTGEELDGFFAAWLDDTGKPAATAENGLAAAQGATHHPSRVPGWPDLPRS